MRTAEFCASLLHTAMQTTHEPTPRPRQMRRVGVHTNSPVTRGLLQAIGQRAVALGMQTRVYVRSWMLDCLEGNLPFEVAPLPLLGMFDDPRAYVLPAVWKKSG